MPREDERVAPRERLERVRAVLAEEGVAHRGGWPLTRPGQRARVDDNVHDGAERPAFAACRGDGVLVAVAALQEDAESARVPEER